VIDTSGNQIKSEPIKFWVRPSQDMSIGDTWPGVGMGMVQTAIGRVVFTMNIEGEREMFACTGTVVQDSKTDRSIVVTAAHCIYDDKRKQFAENALFIPNQAGTDANQTNMNCGDDPLGCWYMDSAVVHDNYTTKVFPSNRKWDYGYYVVGNHGHNHFGGPDTNTGILDVDARAFPISFEEYANGNDFTTVLGHTLKKDPLMSYCSEGITEFNGNYMLPSCEMQGGSSGGPWFSPIDIQGFGNIISVSSWGFREKAGLAAPKFYGESKAECMFDFAKNDLTLDGNRGLSLKGEILTC
jgi:V8-like Glu-specific endopeptidase